MRTTRIAMACVLGVLATVGLTGCVLPTLTLSNTQAKGWNLADPTAIESGGQYTYGTQYVYWRVPVVAPNGAISDALTSNPWWAAGNYTAAPDVRRFPNNGPTRMYFTATKAGYPANKNNCIGVATARPGSLTQFDPYGGAVLCGDGQEFWDPNVEFLGDGTPVLLYSTMNGSTREIRSIRLAPDGLTTQGSPTTLLSNSSTTIENPTAIYDGVAGHWVMLYSQGDWTTSDYSTVMAYCPGTTFTSACNVQGPRGSFPWNPKAFGLYGTGGMDLFDGAGGLNAVYHYWPTDNPFARDRKTAQSNVTITDPQG